MGALQGAHYNEEETSNSSAKLKEMVSNNTNFGKMYAGAIQELDRSVEGEKNWEETEGEWKTFEKGSEPSIMQETLANKRSNLCIGEGSAHAKSYLDTGDMHIYYSKDNRGNYTMPRIAISVQNNSVWEVRGTYNKNEDIDPFIGDILEEKLKDLPQGESFQKKSEDMKRLTEIDNRIKEGRELSIEDIKFLYEIDGSIEGFGYSKDPRIEELLEGRDIKEELSLLTGYSEDEISITKNEALGGNIKHHHGDLDLGSLKSLKGLKLPDSMSGSLDISNIQSFKGSKLLEGMDSSDFISGGSGLQSVTKYLKLPDSIGGNLFLNNLVSAEDLKLPDSIGGDLFLNSLRSARNLKLGGDIGGYINLWALQSAEKEKLKKKYPNLKIM